MFGWARSIIFFLSLCHFDGRCRPSINFFWYESTMTLTQTDRSISIDFLVWVYTDGRYRPIFFYYGSHRLSISTLFSHRWIGIDCRYQPYHESPVCESASTIDIDREISTRSDWWIKKDRLIDNTCERFIIRHLHSGLFQKIEFFVTLLPTILDPRQKSIIVLTLK